jgi:CheY-like chemotaxis protein
MSKKILVVDDHPETVRLIEMTLRRYGYQVFGVESGERALTWTAAHQPDLILLDVMMPDMDGLAVCRKLREDKKLRDVPVIMFTAKSEVQDKMEGFEAGANDYLVKPTRPSELISRVEAILARHDERLAEVGDVREDVEGDDSDDTLPTIAVMGTRGGVGTTTMAINLAATLADQGRASTLVDLDTQQGHVAVYLGASLTKGIQEWLRLPAGSLKAGLPEYLVRIDDRLEMLPARPQPLAPAALPASGSLTDALSALAQRRRAVVFDLGRNRGEFILPLLQQAHQILLCLRPERAAITAARQIAEQLNPLLQRADALCAVMLEGWQGDALPRRAVESYLGFPLFGVLVLEAAQISDAVNRNLPVVRAYPDSVGAEGFRELAGRLMDMAPLRTAGNAWKI